MYGKRFCKTYITLVAFYSKQNVKTVPPHLIHIVFHKIK